MVFIFLGASASLVGRIMFNALGIVRRVGGMIIVLMGLNMLEVLDFSFIPVRGRVIKKHKGMGGSLILGVVLAGGWLPCVGPILASILVLGSNTATMAQGISLLALYSLGFALPIMVSMMLFGTLLNLSKINKYLPFVHKVSGFILIIVGVLVFFDYLSIISIWLGGVL